MVTWLTRRNVLRSGAAALGGAGLTTALNGENPLARAARGYDIDGLEGVNTALVSTAAPGRGEHTAVHATSSGTATQDYVFALVNVMTEGYTLADLIAHGQGLEYDYYVGADDTGMAPCEVCLVLTNTGSGQHAVFRTLNATSDPEAEPIDRETWHTRDVTAEIDGTNSHPMSNQPWKDLDWTALRVDSVGDRITHLEANLLDVVNDDARVRAVGIGYGTPTTGASVADTYIDRFTVAGETVELPTTAERAPAGRGGN